MKISRRQQIEVFLKGRASSAYCDDCLASLLSLPSRQSANQLTRRLNEETYYEKNKVSCNECGSEKLSTQYLLPQSLGNDRGSWHNIKTAASSVKEAQLGLPSLKEIGFHKVGLWVLDGEMLSLQLIRNADMKPALYAFVSKLEILYVGKTSRRLKKRLYHYGRPGPTQSTNIRLNLLLLEALEKRTVIEIYAFGDADPHMKGLFKMDLPAALEDDIIRKTQPKWNKRR